MLAGENKWQAHSATLAYILQQFADHDADFFFGCELGGLQQGVKHAHIDMDKIVHSVLPTRMRNIWCVLRCPQLLTGATDKSDEGAVRRFRNLLFDYRHYLVRCHKQEL